MHVMLVTASDPHRSLGGPGKFVPMFMGAFAQTPGTEGIRLSAVMGARARVYDAEEAFDWADGRPAQPTAPLADAIRWLRQNAASWGRKTYFIGAVRQRVALARRRSRLEAIVEDGRPDLIHCHDFVSVLLPPKRYLGPILLTSHFKGSPYREFTSAVNPEFRSRLWKRYFVGIERAAIHRADGLIFPSDSAVELMLEDFPEMRDEICAKAQVIYTGIPDPCAGAPHPTGEITTGGVKIALSVCNHIPDKGIANSLHIFAQLFEADRQMRFVNIGSFGPCTAQLRALAESLGVAGAVEFRGVQPPEEVHRALRAAVLFIHTPSKVVFDLSLLEAMAFARPVIVSDAKGNVEAVGPEYALIIPGASPRLTSDQLRILASHSESRWWGEHLRKRLLGAFTPTAMVMRYASLWKAYSAVGAPGH